MAAGIAAATSLVCACQLVAKLHEPEKPEALDAAISPDVDDTPDTPDTAPPPTFCETSRATTRNVKVCDDFDEDGGFLGVWSGKERYGNVSLTRNADSFVSGPGSLRAAISADPPNGTTDGGPFEYTYREAFVYRDRGAGSAYWIEFDANIVNAPTDVETVIFALGFEIKPEPLDAAAQYVRLRYVPNLGALTFEGNDGDPLVILGPPGDGWFHVTIDLRSALTEITIQKGSVKKTGRTTIHHYPQVRTAFGVHLNDPGVAEVLLDNIVMREH